MNEAESFQYLKLEIFVPESRFPELQSALQEADAGHIGNYDSCLSFSRVTGMWRPLMGTQPYIGKEGEVCSAQELKVEVTIRKEQLETVMTVIRKVHPYEEPVVNVIPLFYTMRDYILDEKKK